MQSILANLIPTIGDNLTLWLREERFLESIRWFWTVIFRAPTRARPQTDIAPSHPKSSGVAPLYTHVIKWSGQPDQTWGVAITFSSKIWSRHQLKSMESNPSRTVERTSLAKSQISSRITAHHQMSSLRWKEYRSKTHRIYKITSRISKINRNDYF